MILAELPYRIINLFKENNMLLSVIDGKIKTSGSLRILKTKYGDNAEYWELTEEELARFPNVYSIPVKDNKLILGRDEFELKYLEDLEKKQIIKSKLSVIDNKHGKRSIRYLVLCAALKNKLTDNEDYKILKDAETEAEKLRNELKELQ